MIDFSFSAQKNSGTTAIVLPVFSEDIDANKRLPFASLSAAQKRAVRNVIKKNTLPESGFLPVFSGDAPVFLLLLGEEKRVCKREAREAGEGIFALGKKHQQEEFLLASGSLKKNLFSAFAEGVLLGSYEFLRYKGKKKKEEKEKVSLKKVVFLGTGEKQHLEKMVEGVALTKDIINMPPSDARPTYIVEVAKKIAQTKGVTAKIIGEKELEKIGCGGILAVGRGSAEESRLVILEWKGGDKKEAPIALVGKGVTFDTGGNNIKGRHMRWMKQDLGGAATVLGAFDALTKRGVKKNLIALVPTVENMVSRDAYFPDDILTMHNGVTVEVDNTDAEGRLILADALSYCCQEIKPAAMVDLATLTGACAYAVGEDYTAGLSNNTTLFAQLKKSSIAVDEPLWELPLHARYKKLLKSATADIVNCSNGLKAGTIEGGLFLQHFVEEKTPWCHLDIASVAFDEKAGLATGRDVRLLIDFVENFTPEK